MTFQIERLVENAIKLQSIPAPTFQEKDRAAAIQAMFSAVASMEVSQDQAGNVLARISGGKGQPIIITAHLDTVFPLSTPLQCQIEADRIHGPGIGDNAVALAALVELGHMFQFETFPSDLWLVANTTEEGLGNLTGMRAIVERFTDLPLAYIVLEGMALGYIYHRALPVRRYSVSIYGDGGHAWVHSGRPSAIHHLLHLGAAIAKIRLPAKPKTTLNIGTIRGGTSINSIAGFAQFEVDLRSESEATLEKLEIALRRSCTDLRLPAGLSIELTQIGSRPGGGIAVNHPLVSAAANAYQEYGHLNPTLGIASTDANLPLSLNFPSICIGITLGAHAHSLEEYIEISPIADGISATCALVKRLMADVGTPNLG